jgi:hypothetical protein
MVRMLGRPAAPFITVLIFYATSVHFATAVASVPTEQQRPSDQSVSSLVAGDTQVRSVISMLEIQNVRVQAPPLELNSVAAVLKFELFNSSGAPLTAIVLGISISEKPEDDGSPVRTLVRQFHVRPDIVLNPGYTMDFEMLLRNLPADCACTAHVEVVSVRALAQ